MKKNREWMKWDVIYRYVIPNRSITMPYREIQISRETQNSIEFRHKTKYTTIKWAKQIFKQIKTNALTQIDQIGYP